MNTTHSSNPLSLRHFNNPFLSISIPPSVVQQQKSATIWSKKSIKNCTPSSMLVVTANSTETRAKILDGKAPSKQILDEIRSEVSSMKESIGAVPGLAVIQVGDRNKDFTTYVRNTIKACGITSYKSHLPEDCTEEQVLKHISDYNSDPSVHGILVQLPLPPHMNEENILNAINIEKDVDGFHPLNNGRLAMRGREPFFVPCTPLGCIKLQNEDATVTTIHTSTECKEKIIKQADIIIAAAGEENKVGGTSIIDVGINPTRPRGYRLASAITPVPGGVIPMSIAMLMFNTLTSAKRAYNFM